MRSAVFWKRHVSYLWCEEVETEKQNSNRSLVFIIMHIYTDMFCSIHAGHSLFVHGFDV